MPIQDQTRGYYQNFAGFLEKYEEAKDKAGLVPNQLAHVRLISGQKGGLLKEKLELMCDKQTNPTKHINNWVKGEVWCLEGLLLAKSQIDDMDRRREKTIKDIADTQDTINKLNAGKFTFGSMLKSDAEKKAQAMQKAQLKIELEKDVEAYIVLKRLLTIYMATIAIPAYKKQRTEAYVRAMGHMCKDEIGNAESTLDCWSNFKNVIETFRIK